LTAPAPGWLEAWRRSAVPAAEALARFDALPPVEPTVLRGVWRGRGLPTGHPLDGLLEALGWYGKAFASDEEVHPLLFDAGPRGILAVEPAWLPASLPLRLPRLARSAASRRAFRAALPLLAARRPGARLARLPFRGMTSAAMIYHSQPITDHFRAIDPARLLGVMERTGMAAPYVILLERTDLALSPAGGRIAVPHQA
jgi:hypothetical protein